MLEAMLILFVFGGVWFWGLLGLASLLLITALERDKGSAATVVFVGTLAALLFMGNSSWLTWVFQNPLYFGLGVLGYLTVGVGWGIGKWWIYVRDCAIRHRRKRREWLGRHGKTGAPQDGLDVAECREALRTGVLTGEIKEAWQKHVRDYWEITKPMASRCKGKIVAWMTYWPWSALWTLINDPVRRFFSWAYGQLSGMLQGISDRAFKDIEMED